MPDRELGSHNSCLLVYKPHRGLCSEARWDSKQLLFQTPLWIVKNYSAQENTLWCNTEGAGRHTGCLYLLLFTSGDFRLFHRLHFKHFLIYMLKKHTCEVQYFQLLITVWNFIQERQANDRHNQRESKDELPQWTLQRRTQHNTVVMDDQE